MLWMSVVYGKHVPKWSSISDNQLGIGMGCLQIKIQWNSLASVWDYLWQISNMDFLSRLCKNRTDDGATLRAKQFMQAVNIRLTQYAVRLSRKDLRLLVGLLTGHNTLNGHLTLLRRIDDPLCPLCGEEEDTICSAIAEKRCEFFGRY